MRGFAWKRFLAISLAIAALVVGVTFVLMNRRRADPALPPLASAQDLDISTPYPTNPGYVGSQACVDCHAQRVTEFQRTRHFLACRTPQPDAMPVGFQPGKGTIVRQDPAIRFEMSRRGDEFLQSTIRPDNPGVRVESPIGLIYGGGGVLDEVYFSWRGEWLRELPVVWLHPQSCWGTSSSQDPHGQGDFSRDGTTRCLECHNTWMAHVPGTPSQYRRDDLILGVSCERCHGPGKEHVAYHRQHPEETAAHAIVYPAKLARDRQIDICAQCHSNTTRRRGPAFSYRPGQPLDDFFRTAVTPYPEEDHVANQTTYLMQSKCYAKSEALSCTTCHNPHRQTNLAAVRGACAKCHQPKDCKDQARLPEAIRGDCASCHMPARVWMNVNFRTDDEEYLPPIRRFDHRIGVYPEVRKEMLRDWLRSQKDPKSAAEADRLTAELVDYWRQEAEKRRGQHRHLAVIGALREALRIDPTAENRTRVREAAAIQSKLTRDWYDALHLLDQQRLPQAKESLERILAIKPDLATAIGRLGTVEASLGRLDLAKERWQAAAAADPNDAYGYNMIGWTAFLQDRPDEALTAFRRAEEIEPFTAELNYRMGLALLKLENFPDAAKRFRLALEVDPRQAGACQGLSHALRQQGQVVEAARYAMRAAKLTNEENADVLITLAEIQADLKRTGEFEATSAKALAVAEKANPRDVGVIRQRLEEIRARMTAK